MWNQDNIPQTLYRDRDEITANNQHVQDLFRKQLEKDPG